MLRCNLPLSYSLFPLCWFIWMLEGCGFEIETVDNIGVHYAVTYHKWYTNWKNNEDKIIKSLGIEVYRKVLWYFAWNIIATEQGSFTYYHLVCHKNTRAFDRKEMIKSRDNLWKL